LPISEQVKADLALLGVAFIWGVTFVVVQDALSDIGPYYFLAVRFLLAFLFLLIIFFKQFRRLDRETLTAGCLIGLFLFAGYAFQTVGLKYTSASNAGFITGLSVVLVPVFHALATRRPPNIFVAAGVFCAAAGLGLLSLGKNLQINYGDLLVLFCAVCFAMQIILVGHYASRHNPNLLAAIQIGIVSLVSFVFGAVTENMPAHFTRPVWVAFLLTAIPATSLAFLIQNKMQRFTSSTHTAIIFSMEPVFAALTAFFAAGESLSLRQAAGCALILGGMLLAELKGEREEEQALKSSGQTTVGGG